MQNFLKNKNTLWSISRNEILHLGCPKIEKYVILGKKYIWTGGAYGKTCNFMDAEGFIK